MTEHEVAEIVSKLVDKLMAEAIGLPPKPNKLTCLQYVGGRFESREIDDDGKIIEPPARCCYGAVLHAPNCKSWWIVS
jgi:hypothetical protein